MRGAPMPDERTMVTFTVGNARVVEGRKLFALVDVEMEIAGVAIVIFGLQARRLPHGGTSIHLPTYKGADGTWQPAIALPEEVKAPVADAVLAHLIEEGFAEFATRPASG